MTETEQPGREDKPGEPTGKTINLEALAERVFRLLLEEARLERERLGRNQAR